MALPTSLAIYVNQDALNGEIFIDAMDTPFTPVSRLFDT